MALKLPFTLIVVPPSLDYSGLLPSKKINPAMPLELHHYLVGVPPDIREVISVDRVSQFVLATVALQTMCEDERQAFLERIREHYAPTTAQCEIDAILRLEAWFATLQTVSQQRLAQYGAYSLN